jgi:hypothetical protein
MTCRATLIALGLLVLGAPVPAQAQTPGPWVMTAPANPDHATVAQGVNVVSSYELVVTPQGGGPLPALSLGKPALVASCTIGTATVQNCLVVDVNTYVNGLPPGTYTAVLRALGPGGQAASPAGPPFPLVVPAPGQQGAPALSRSSTALRQAPPK